MPARSLLLLVALLGVLAPLAFAAAGEACAGCCCGPEAGAACPCEVESGPADPLPTPDRTVAPDAPVLPAADVRVTEVLASIGGVDGSVRHVPAPERPPARLLNCVRTL